ncbi:MAG: nitronate monooxygenase family protein [Desulfovibrio sp.]|nr:nitronate monooxygenase family protein [Desulfovibrio sp.]
MAIPPLHIGNLTARLPIIQGGMGIGISLSGLASAVARAGGVGVIATPGIGMDEPDFRTNWVEANSRALAREIRQAKANAQGGVIGVNIMTVLTNSPELIATATAENADIILSGAGLPLSLPKYVTEGSTTKLAPIVSSGRAAALIARSWHSKCDRLPDAVVVEGPLAGGHLGFKREELDDPAMRLELLVAETIEALKPFVQKAGRDIPVIAAGGIYTGADIRAIMDLGASAVQLGTRFVATHECDAHIAFKHAFVDATRDDMVIVDSPVGLPGRALRNTFVEGALRGEKKPFSCPYHCLKSCDPTKSPYCIALALKQAQRGMDDTALRFAGANAWRVDKLVHVQELMDELVAGYEAAAV